MLHMKYIYNIRNILMMNYAKRDLESGIVNKCTYTIEALTLNG